MYAKFAKVAQEEGFSKIAFLLEGVAAIEKTHEERYQTLLENLKEGKVFKRELNVVWQCSNCGHLHIGLQPPEVCPVCDHPKAYFKILAENY